jgi:hypothetical protein
VEHNVDVTDNGQRLPIYAFFRTNYRFAQPPVGTFSLRLYGAVHAINLSSGVRGLLAQSMPITHLRQLL